MREFTTDVGVRYRDLDAFGHVNNAVYATYFEEARVAYLREVLDRDPDAIETVLAALEIEYRSPIRELEPVEVAVRAAEPGESSLTLTYEVRAGGDVVAVGETVQVRVDPGTGEAVPLPDAWRDRIAAFHGG